jgi:hypothetical protein
LAACAIWAGAAGSASPSTSERQAATGCWYHCSMVVLQWLYFIGMFFTTVSPTLCSSMCRDGYMFMRCAT